MKPLITHLSIGYCLWIIDSTPLFEIDFHRSSVMRTSGRSAARTSIRSGDAFDETIKSLLPGSVVCPGWR